MDTLKYKVIKSKAQYREYCHRLEGLVDTDLKSKALRDEVDLLTLLIETWDEEHSALMDSDPIQLLHAFLKDHQMKATDLVSVLNLSKGYISDMLNYKKGLSKETIRGLSAYFKVSHEAFNRPYKLKSSASARMIKSRRRNPAKQLVAAR